MALVLDASYALAIALEEVEPALNAAMLERLAVDGAVVPPIWRFEFANGLLSAVRRKRIAPTRPSAILSEFELLPIITDPLGGERAWSATLEIAEGHGLTLYDAAYLELAARLQSPLASFDSALNQAARQRQVEVMVE